jgi:hypothetical protein
MTISLGLGSPFVIIFEQDVGILNNIKISRVNFIRGLVVLLGKS